MIATAPENDDDDNGDEGDDKNKNGWCPLTSWTRVYKIRDSTDSDDAAKALEKLCSDYRRPVFKAFSLKYGLNHEDAEDATQEFLVWFLEAQFVLKADREIGKFRTFLFTYLDNFARNHCRKLRNQNGKGAPHLSIHQDSTPDQPGIDIVGTEDPIREIHLDWARSTLDAARNALGEQEIKAGNEAEWKVIRTFLSAGSKYSIDAAAAEIGISTDNMKVKIHRLRERFYILLSKQVSATVTTKDEFKEEMAFLRDVFS